VLKEIVRPSGLIDIEVRVLSRGRDRGLRGVDHRGAV
jgi:hypothetical protein